MALQSSGAISIGDIRTELGETTGSLRSLSATAGFSTPDAISEFYGYSGQSAPSVTTNAASSVAVSTVTLNGNVTSDGGATVTARGFYFGTNSNATSNPAYASGSGTGAYSLARTGLTGSTTYYFAAYATNATGTTVGGTLSFTTQVAATIHASYYGTNKPDGYQNLSAAQAELAITNNTGNVWYHEIGANYYKQHNHPDYGWTTDWSDSYTAKWNNRASGRCCRDNLTYVSYYSRKNNVNSNMHNRFYVNVRRYISGSFGVPAGVTGYYGGFWGGTMRGGYTNKAFDWRSQSSVHGFSSQNANLYSLGLTNTTQIGVYEVAADYGTIKMGTNYQYPASNYPSVWHSSYCWLRWTGTP
jgi:hypothetical protein